VQRLLDEVSRVAVDHLANGAEIELGGLRLSLADGIEILGVEVLGDEPLPSGDQVFCVMSRDSVLRRTMRAHYPHAVFVHDGGEMPARLETGRPDAIVVESSVTGAASLVRELKCNPATNAVPVIGIYPEEALDAPLSDLAVQPDAALFEPCTVAEIREALATHASRTRDDVVELEMHLPGTTHAREHACGLVEEVLYRSGMSESFCSGARRALAEALDNAVRHGHGGRLDLPVLIRLFLDDSRLVLAVRDSGDGFAHGAVIDPYAQAAMAPEGGIARMIRLVDMVDYNAFGTEVVLTKLRRRR
jgi:anti-sigma regulatory factor (Ser/Thr protein kinase)